MQNKKVLLLTSDLKIRGEIENLLSSTLQLKVATSSQEALQSFEETAPDLLILDYHLQGEDGLEVFKKLKRRDPRLKAILIVLPSDIEIAVHASKLGILDVVRKPIEKAALLTALEEYLKKPSAPKGVIYAALKDTEWLDGAGFVREHFLGELTHISQDIKDVILVGRRGISSAKVAEVIHHNSLKKDRKLVSLNLASFQNESSESYFWVMIRELLLEQEEVSDKKEELCGTLFLEAFGSIETHFQASILEFLREEKVLKKRGKVDQGIKIVINISSREVLEALPGHLLENFVVLAIPPLVKRREDLPVLVGDLIAKFNLCYGKKIQGISLSVLELLSYYPFPGNYSELENLIKNAVLLAETPLITLKEMPLTIQTFLDAELALSLQKDTKKMEKVLGAFNKKLYTLLLAKTDGDEARVARFLDLPVEGLTAKLKESGLL